MGTDTAMVQFSFQLLESHLQQVHFQVNETMSAKTEHYCLACRHVHIFRLNTLKPARDVKFAILIQQWPPSNFYKRAEWLWGQ